MFPFHKPAGDKRSLLSPAWDKLGKLLTKYARKWADHLNYRAAKIRSRGKWLLLILFCLPFGCGGVYLFLAGLRQKNSATTIPKISFPAITAPVDKQMHKSSPAIFSSQEITYLNWVRSYLDSLQHAGSPIYDSIIRINPELPENLSTVEKWMNELYKNK